jgi:hypothetical protein
MLRLFSLLLLGSLSLTACGRAPEDDTGSSLEGMFNPENGEERGDSENSDPQDTPYSVGPSEIPADLIPND